MHFHVDRTVRAKNENLSPGIFTVNAFAFALFSLARQSFVHSLTTTTKTCHSIANTLVRNTALMAKLATTDSPSTPTSLNTKDTTEGKFEHKRIILVPLTASPPTAPHLPKLHGEQNPRLQQHNITFAGGNNVFHPQLLTRGFLSFDGC